MLIATIEQGKISNIIIMKCHHCKIESETFVTNLWSTFMVLEGVEIIAGTFLEW